MIIHLRSGVHNEIDLSINFIYNFILISHVDFIMRQMSIYRYLKVSANYYYELINILLDFDFKIDLLLSTRITKLR